MKGLRNIASLELAHIPVAFLAAALVQEPLAAAMSRSTLEGAPEDADVVNVATPAVEEVITELAFVDEVLDLTADAIQLTLHIELAVARLRIVAADATLVIDVVAIFGTLANDISRIQNALLLPVVDRGLENLRVAELGHEAREVSRLRLKYLG